MYLNNPSPKSYSGHIHLSRCLRHSGGGIKLLQHHLTNPLPDLSGYSCPEPGHARGTCRTHIFSQVLWWSFFHLFVNHCYNIQPSTTISKTCNYPIWNFFFKFIGLQMHKESLAGLCCCGWVELNTISPGHSFLILMTSSLLPLLLCPDQPLRKGVF